MNIEEAVKIIKELIDGVEEYGYDYTVEEAVVINKSEYNAIETLLTAYEKEKEKNKRLEKFIENGEYTWKQKYNETFEYFKAELEKEKEKNNNVLGLIFEYGQTDGEHHKAWVIDQIVRIITENNYDKWVQHYEYDEETDEDYFWDVGIAP